MYANALPASVSKTLLVRFDYNKYSVHAKAAGRPVDVHAYADRIVIRQDGKVVGEHVRRFGREQTVYDPWHYLPVLERKPGALRNGAPFKDWALPPAIEQVRRRLGHHGDADRQMVGILVAAVTDAQFDALSGRVSGLENGLADVNFRLEELDQGLSGGIAAAAALGSAIAMPDKAFTIAGNVATYNGEQGYALGLTARVGGSFAIGAGVAGNTGDGEVVAQAGFAFGF